MTDPDPRTEAHRETSRRYFLQLGGVAAAAWNASPLAAAEFTSDPRLQEAIGRLEYLTPFDKVEKSMVYDKAKSGVASMPLEKLREVGQTPETWDLEVVADPASNSVVDRPLSRAQGNALDWNGLMKLAEKHVVRFLHVCCCTNGADPFHMTLWEGVPLREIVWLAKPRASVRRAWYESYHPEGLQPFLASLALGLILETPPGQMPPILAYKMNGKPIPASLGGPARVLVPGAYGSKQIKWVRRIVLTNNYKSNDSDAEPSTDTESPIKTRARFIYTPKEIAAQTPAAITGIVQIGISGLHKVQYAVHSQSQPWPADDPNWSGAEWKDAAVLPPPADWGAGLGKLPEGVHRIDPRSGAPLEWPMKFTAAHWAALVPGLPAGSYDLCCRTIDGNGIAQPMPRPLLRTGFNAIHRATLTVKG
jgi:DMSO/TMAO reductase YedYZ molybdopterin-dependent catalytic subunit